MVGIIGITTTLILNERESTSSVNDISAYYGKKQRWGGVGKLTGDWQQFEEQECRSGRDGHSCEAKSVVIPSLQDKDKDMWRDYHETRLYSICQYIQHAPEDV